jgi:DNA-binding MarR family transcriptional regulator
MRDGVDDLLDAWRTARPDLDPSALGLVGRVIVLGQYLERSVNRDLDKYKISLGQFDILATLRRNQPKGGLTPTQLLGSVMLSSGGMTSRLDTLEREGWIERQPDPRDRRGVVIELTEKGKKLIDEATETRFQEAVASKPQGNPEELQQFEMMLRRWLSRYLPKSKGD